MFMIIRGIHHVSFIVHDTKTSLEFYCGVLKLPLNSGRPVLPFAGAWLEVGGQQIHLIEREMSGQQTSVDISVNRDFHAAFYVKGLDDLKQSLTQANIPYTSSQRRAALFCRDPDGNGLEFIEAD